ncbi:MAG: protein kinase [Acidobacteria bacterium]|nr:protein kinase [Acidobacteriota bacterium]
MKPRNAGDVQSISSATTIDSGDTAASRQIQTDSGAIFAGWPLLSGYEILAELGCGGMGVVYKAREKQTGRLVALKMMRRPDAASLIRFKQEFRSLQEVSHPNLVTLLSAVAEEGWWFFTMELLEGADFVAYVRSGGFNQQAPVPPPSTTGTVDALSGDQLSRLRSVLPQLAEGLAALHAAGKVHRDIKPSNVLVTKEGKVKILDFGLAADINPTGLHETTEQNIIGTIAYMSPEQGSGEPVSGASDWYSVGALLFEALTGRRPFKGSISEVLIAKTGSEPTPPHTIISGVPDDLDRLCTELLRRDPAARPSDTEVVARLAAIHERSSEVLQSPPQHTGIVFIGREHCLTILEDALETVRKGAGVLVRIHGRSGIGKTALVRHFLDQIRHDQELVVLEGKCYEREAVPYKALDSVIDALSRYLRRPEAKAERLLPRDVWPLARAFPVLLNVPALADAPQRASETADPPELRRRAFGALRELLARLGDRRPVVIWIDDLQWGDTDSARLLLDLLTPPDPPRILLLACYRDEEVESSPFLSTFLGAEIGRDEGKALRDLQIDPLTLSDTRSLAMALFDKDDVSSEKADVIARESGGNPFFVGELVQRAHAGGSASAGEITLDSLIRARVRVLPDNRRRLLEVIAVSGRPIALTVASSAAELEADSFEVINSLCSEHLARTLAGKIEIYHDRIREAIVEGLSPQELLDCHRRLIQLLENEDTDPEVLAVHCEGARQPEKAARYCIQAADQAADAFEFERAARLYRRALDLNPVDKTEDNRLRTRLAAALANAGRVSEAAEEYLAVAGGTASKTTFELKANAARHYVISGHVEKGFAVLRELLAELGITLPSARWRTLMTLILMRMQLWLRGTRFKPRPVEQVSAEDLARIDICYSIGIGLVFQDPIHATFFLTRSLLRALHIGETYRIVRGLAAEAGLLAAVTRRTRQRARRLLKLVENLARGIEDPYLNGMLLFVDCYLNHTQGNWNKALQQCEQAEKVFSEQCIGVAGELEIMRLIHVDALFLLGGVAELRERLPALIKQAEDRGNLFSVTTFGVNFLPFHYLAVDDVESAAAALSRYSSRLSRQSVDVQHYFTLRSQLWMDLYTGRGTAAWKHVTEQLPRLERSMMMNVTYNRIAMRYLHGCSALAAAAEGHAGSLLGTAEREARKLESEKLAWAAVFALLLRAAVTARSGDPKGGISLLADAADRLKALDMNLWAAAARRRLGELLGGEEGLSLVREADERMLAMTIRNPQRMAGLLVPDFLNRGQAV